MFVTLVAADPDATWARRLEALGAAVGAYDPDTRAYTAVAAADAGGSFTPNVTARNRGDGRPHWLFWRKP